MSVIPKRFLFQFRFPCRHVEKIWTPKGCPLDDSYRLPSLKSLEDTSDAAPFSLKVGWNEQGLAFSLDVTGKKHRPWCRSTHPEESDGLQICLDTRDVKDVHRATRFCHRLVFLPMLTEIGRPEPSVVWLPIHRAKGHPNAIDLKRIKIASRVSENGYRLDIALPAEVLTGYDPVEHPTLGFHFVRMDRELGNRYFLVEPPFPHDQDPSLWGTLELIP